MKQNKTQSACAESTRKDEEVPLVEFIYLVFSCMPGESYRKQVRSLLFLCYVFWAVINSLVCWFLTCNLKKKIRFSGLLDLTHPFQQGASETCSIVGESSQHLAQQCVHGGLQVVGLTVDSEDKGGRGHQVTHGCPTPSLQSEWRTAETTSHWPQ